MSKRVLWMLAVCAALAAPALAQTQITTGVIQGTVEDTTGAVVPEANVEARNASTNLTRTLSTGPEGRFVFLQLPPGRYTLTVTKAGFATHVQENMVLTVGQAITLNPKMKVSSVAETVTVTGTPTVDVSRTAVTNTLDETTISTTPILGRKFEDLLTLTPGVSVVQGPDGDEITFNGQRGIFNNVSLDGGDYNNGFFGEQMGGQRAAIDITLEAVKEFQVVAQGANAEFGRTAGGIINVITKSGSNELHGSLFHYQRLEALTSNTSDGKPLKDFHREQFGGTLGGPIVKDKAFFFAAVEHLGSSLTRDNLSAPIGTCPTANPNVAANQGLIASNLECQRLALLDFFRTSRNQEEGAPIERTIDNTALLLKLDWTLNPNHNLAVSWNFDHSKNENETFDVALYGNSANGTEGASKINVANLNLFSTISPTKLNEFHVTYSRENRPRQATPSNVPADTAMDFVNTFRFGNPFFLQPAVDELATRFQFKDNFSIVSGKHTIKFGGEWMRTKNDQVFRGFFSGRYIFDSVVGFLRYASPAAPGGFGPNTVPCSDGSYVTYPTACPAGTTSGGSPLLLYIQESGSGFPGVPAAGASILTNDEFSLFAQDQWQPRPGLTLNYGLRWDAQYMADTVNPATTVFASFLGNPDFPSDGTIPDQKKQFQPRLGVAWDVKGDGKTVVRANAGIYYARHNMLSQAGSVTANGLQNQGAVRGVFTGLTPTGVPGIPMPVWPNILPSEPLAPGQFPLFTSIRVTASDFRNPKITTANVAVEREFAPDWSLYADFTWAKGVYLPTFININSAARGGPFSPQLGDVFVAYSRAKGLYRGGTLGVRKRFSNGYQVEANYVLAKDMDTDSNERDPFTDFSFDIPLDQLNRNYGPSARDIRHKFNLFAYGELPGGLRGNVRMQARSAQPITPSPRFVNGVDLGRNSDRKDNKYFSVDWRLTRPIKWGSRAELIPTVEMFNTFKSDNNINPLVTPGLVNFDGFLRQGVGDPRQVQLALKFTW